MYRRYQVDQFIKDVEKMFNSSITDDGCSQGVHLWEALEETTNIVRSNAQVILIHVSYYSFSLYFTLIHLILCYSLPLSIVFYQ